MEIFIGLAVFFDNCMMLLVWVTVLGTNNGRILRKSYSATLKIIGFNVRDNLAAGPQPTSFYDSNFDSITVEI